MDKKIILFDIDKTLLNPYPIMEDLTDEIKNEFHKKIDVFEIYDEYVKKLESSTDFDPKDFLELLSKKTKVPITKLSDYFYNSKIWEDYVYEDVNGVLSRIETKFNLGIFSEGFDKFQNEKLIMSKLSHFFKKNLLFISRRKLDNTFLKTIPEKVIIIDDKKEVVKKLRDFGGFEVFWLNRNNEVEKIEGVKEIKNLRELENFI